MEVKKITEGMTAPQVAQVIDDNFKGIIGETDAKLSELGSEVGMSLDGFINRDNTNKVNITNQTIPYIERNFIASGKGRVVIIFEIYGGFSSATIEILGNNTFEWAVQTGNTILDNGYDLSSNDTSDSGWLAPSSNRFNVFVPKTKYLAFKFRKPNDAAISESEFNEIKGYVKNINTGLSDVYAYKGMNVGFIQNIDGSIANIDTKNKIINFGSDIIIHADGNTYPLKNVEGITSVPYFVESSSSGACYIVFNKETVKVYPKVYNTIADNEIVIGGVRSTSPDHNFLNASFPFSFTIDGCFVPKNLVKPYMHRQSVGLIASRTGMDIPNINNETLTLDLGEDPILFINGINYPLSLFGNTNFRNIPLSGVGSSAVLVLFDTNTKSFRTTKYDSKDYNENEVIIGYIRLNSGLNGVEYANFPFEYTIDGKNSYESYVDKFVGMKVRNSLEDFEIGLYKADVTGDGSIDRFRWLMPVSANIARFITKSIPEGYDYGLAMGGRYSSTNGEIYDKTYDSGWLSTAKNIDLTKYIATSKYLIVTFRKTDNAVLTDADVETIKNNFAFEYQWSKTINEVADMVDCIKALRCKTGIKVMAHRGFHLNGVPENSLDAFRLASYCGFDYVEADFCPTKDGKLVLMHDESINRTMRNKSDYSAITSTINVADKTLSELRENYVLEASDPRMRGQIPTLEEFFVTCRENGLFPIPEIKSQGMTRDYIRDAYELGVKILGDGNFGFNSFSEEYLDYARSLSNNIKLFYINNGILGTNNSITGESRVSPNTYWFPPYAKPDWNQSLEGLSKEKVATYKENGVGVATWLPPVKEFNNMLKWGVDIIACDHVAPSMNGATAKVVSSFKNWENFTTHGVIENKTVLLESGKTLQLEIGNPYIGGYYLSIVLKGSVRISAPNLDVEVSTNGTERFIYQGLIDDTLAKFVVTAINDSEVSFCEFSVVEFA